MIDAIVEQDLPEGAMVRLEPGTLKLRRCREGEGPTFSVMKELKAGAAVTIIPLDLAKLNAIGVQMAGSYVFKPATSE